MAADRPPATEGEPPSAESLQLTHRRSQASLNGEPAHSDLHTALESGRRGGGETAWGPVTLCCSAYTWTNVSSSNRIWFLWETIRD